MAKHRCYGRRRPCYANALELKLKSGLEELSGPFEVEAVEATDAIGGFKAKIVGQVPVDHRCKALELTSVHQFAVEIDVGEARNQLYSTIAAGEQRPLGDYLSEGSLDCVVDTRLPGDAPRCDEVAAVDGRTIH